MKQAFETVRRHLDAWNSRDKDAIAETVGFPFIQYDHDGSVQICKNKSELFDFDALAPFTASLADVELVDSGPTIAVVRLGFAWEYPQSGFKGVGNAIWGLEMRGQIFVLRWRQFLGWRDGVTP